MIIFMIIIVIIIMIIILIILIIMIPCGISDTRINETHAEAVAATLRQNRDLQVLRFSRAMSPEELSHNAFGDIFNAIAILGNLSVLELSGLFLHGLLL